MIENLFRPFRTDVVEFIEQGCAIPAEQARIAGNILTHSFTGLFLSSILRGEVSQLYDIVIMKQDEKVSEAINNLIIRCRNEFDRHLDIHPTESRYLALYLVNFSIDQIRDQYEAIHMIRNQHTFRQFIMKAA